MPKFNIKAQTIPTVASAYADVIGTTDNQIVEIKNELILHQKKEMERISADIDRFVLKFDYRNADMPWENAKDAPERAIFKLRGEYDGKF